MFISFFLLFGCKSEKYFARFKFSKSKYPKYVVAQKTYIQTIAIKLNQKPISNSLCFHLQKDICFFFFFCSSWATANITEVMYFHGLVAICGCLNRTSINILNIDTVYFSCFSFIKMLRAIQYDAPQFNTYSNGLEHVTKNCR